jgi:thioredoxin reductase (NADPH)
MSPVADVIIVGAGPAGLAAAIAASRREMTALILEKGVLVNSLFQYPAHMVFFTTPELMEIGGLPFVSPYEKPTRLEALRYYRRALEAFRLDVQFRERVLSVDAAGGRGFRVESESEVHGRQERFARAVVIATGAYDVPNRLGVPGEDLPHVSHYYREAHPHFRQRVVIVGGKNSAAEAALELYRAGARVLLVHRREALGESIKYWVKPDIENRIKEGSIAAQFQTRVETIEPGRVRLTGPEGSAWEPADAVLLMTGYRSDNDLLTRAGVQIDPSTRGPVHDPDTFETNVPNLFVAGAVIAGVQSGRIFIENGRFHGEVVIKAIAQRLRR